MNKTLAFRLIFSSLMSMLMATIMTAWITWLNVGLSSDYLQRWGHAFINAWPAAFILVLFAAPTVTRFAHTLMHRLESRFPAAIRQDA
jgi:hypothetical protein